ncbi:MAG TPA: DnaD domain-containing protein [Bacillota bacterium]|nr:DnaD domain-containing protein [Bacillota bacterium]
MDSRMIQQLMTEQMTVPTKLITNYKTLGLTESDFSVILHIHYYLQQNVEFPTPSQLAKHLTMDEKECAKILRRLIQKQLLTIEQKQSEDNILSESYNLTPLWEKLYEESAPLQREANNEEGLIFVSFEQEFGRPLSPFEIEMVSNWLDEDHFDPSLIEAALRESVLMGKLNFTYIDRILRSWKQKGIQTVEDARESSREFRDYQAKQATETSSNEQTTDASLYFNWLEED